MVSAGNAEKSMNARLQKSVRVRKRGRGRIWVFLVYSQPVHTQTIQLGSGAGGEGKGKDWSRTEVGLFGGRGGKSGGGC